MRALLISILYFSFSVAHATICPSGIKAVNRVVAEHMQPSSASRIVSKPTDAAEIIRTGGVTQDGLVYRSADGLTDVKANTEVLVKRGDRGWTRGTVSGTDHNGRVLVDFVEDGVAKTKPVLSETVSTNIKLLDDQASLMAPGKRVIIQRNGGGSSAGHVTSYDEAGNVRVDFFDEKSGSWAHKVLTPDKVERLVKPITTQSNLVLRQGEAVEIFSRTDNAYNSGRISHIDDSGNVYLEYTLKDGRVATKTIGPDSVDQYIKASSTVNPKSSIQNIFENSPVHNQPKDAMFSAGRDLPDGSRASVRYVTEDREIARMQGKLFEGVSPSDLPKGKSYTYIVKEDGKMVFGQVDDGWEVGVKHAHLANGDNVLVAGEISLDASGAYKWNLESGSYTRKILQGGQTDMATLEKQMTQVFNEKLGASGQYVDDVLLNSGPPSMSNVKILCADQRFKMLNAAICNQLGL